MIMRNNILIIGSGAFGVALSQPLIDNENNVYFYTKKQETIDGLMNGQHRSVPNIKLEKPTKCFSDLKEAFQQNINYLILAIPSAGLPDLYNEIKPFLNENITIVNTSKGLSDQEEGVWSKLFLKDNIVKKYSLIVGPSFADELVKKNKTIINVVSNNREVAKSVQNIFNNNYFKLVYFSDEYLASLASSFKNSLALALGLLNHYSDSINTQSAYLTIGLNEVQTILNRLTNSCEVKILDFFGVGDIFLTCTSDMSRNYRFGKQIGQFGFKEAQKINQNMTIEGVRTLKFIKQYIDEYNLELPLFNCLYQICYENKNPNTFLDYVWEAI